MHLHGLILKSELIEWLETRAIELQPTISDKMGRQHMKIDPRKHPQRRVVFQVNEKKGNDSKLKLEKLQKCLMCGGNHKIWECKQFREQCAKVRSELVKSFKLCLKCLLKHQLGICDNEDCNHCGGPHNVMLCYKKENENKRKLEPRRAIEGPRRAIEGPPNQRLSTMQGSMPSNSKN